MQNKKKLILIVLVIALCIIGIGWYAKDFNKKDNKKQITTNVDNKIVKITDKTAVVKVSPDKIKNIDSNQEVCDVMDDSHFIVVETGKLILRSDKDKKQQVIKKLPKDSKITSVKTYKNYIVFIEKDVEKHNDDDEPFSINTIYVYNTADKSLTKVKGGSLVKKSDGTFDTKEYVHDFIQLHDGNLFYCVYNPAGDNYCKSTIFKYDIENKQEKQIYRQEPSKEANYGIISFDIDLEKGFLVCEQSDNNIEKLELINLKNNNKKTLANTQGMFSLELSYPNVAFTFNNDIHVYNIEKNDDDLCIKCDDTPLAGIAFKDKKLIFCTNEIYCYSMKEKKLYDIDKAESEIASNDKYVYYNNNGKVNYIKIDDIN